MSKNIIIKFLHLHFCSDFNSEKICFIKFLQSSKIQFLHLNNLFYTEKFDSPDFSQFRRNYDSLLGLQLGRSDNDFKLYLILEELSFNKTLQILNLTAMNLTNFSSNLVNLINTNQTISTLILYDSFLKIESAFIDAFLKSKTLFYLVLLDAKIEEDSVLKLAESNLKGINVDRIMINVTTKDLVYKRIPKIEFDLYSDNFLKYEQLLRPIN